MSIRRELMIELKKIYDDKDFVCSTVDIAKTERSWRILLDYINTAKKNKDVLSPDNIQLVALRLRDEEDSKQQENIRKRVAAAIL